jgi:tripartite-type tricarboxylate transporter receptor subunit TctC
MEVRMKNAIGLLAACAACALAFAASAQNRPAYPDKPVTLVVGFAAGGAADTVARFLADYAREHRNVQMVVENRPGASGTTAADRVTRAAPDGYTLMVASPSPIWVLPQLQKLGYDPLQGLTPVGQLISQPLPLYVRADSPFNSYAEVLKFARENPGSFRWGTSGARGFAEIVMEAAFKREKVETTTVPFKGGAEAIVALLGGHIEAVASSDFGPVLQDRKVKLLVETGPYKIAQAPQVPTFRELGYPLCLPVFYGLFGPGGMDPQQLRWWDTLVKDAVASPKFARVAQTMGGTPAFQPSAEFANTIRRGYVEFGKALAVEKQRL